MGLSDSFMLVHGITVGEVVKQILMICFMSQLNLWQVFTKAAF